MPRDGSGNYTLPVGNPVVSNTVIASSWANDTMSDIATQLNNVLTRDGVLGPTLPFKLVDGNVNAPGLGFNSEPGLGLYRINTSILGFAAAGKQTMVNDASTAGAVITSLYPRSAGQAELRLNADIYGTADTTVMRLYQSSAGGIIQSLAVGAGLMKPLIYTASAHSFTGPVIAEPNAISSRFISDIALNVAAIGSYDYTTTDMLRFRLQYAATGGEASNAGNFSIYRYQNDGVASENAFNIDRASGSVDIQRVLNVGTALGVGVVGLSVTRDVQIGGALGMPGGSINVSAGSVTASNGFIWNASSVTGLVSTGFIAGGTRTVLIANTGSIGDTSVIQTNHTPAVSTNIQCFAGASSFTMSNDGIGRSVGGWVATSDKRLKTNPALIENALEKLATLSGYTFDREDMVGLDGVVPRKAGYYAQEVQNVLPEAVMMARDEMGTLSVDHNGVIGLLIEAVKELDARTQIH